MFRSPLGRRGGRAWTKQGASLQPFLLSLTQCCVHTSRSLSVQSCQLQTSRATLHHCTCAHMRLIGSGWSLRREKDGDESPSCPTLLVSVDNAVLARPTREQMASSSMDGDSMSQAQYVLNLCKLHTGRHDPCTLSASPIRAPRQLPIERCNTSPSFRKGGSALLKRKEHHPRFGKRDPAAWELWEPGKHLRRMRSTKYTVGMSIAATSALD